MFNHKLPQVEFQMQTLRKKTSPCKCESNYNLFVYGASSDHKPTAAHFSLFQHATPPFPVFFFLFHLCFSPGRMIDHSPKGEKKKPPNVTSRDKMAMGQDRGKLPFSVGKPLHGAERSIFTLGAVMRYAPTICLPIFGFLCFIFV